MSGIYRRVLASVLDQIAEENATLRADLAKAQAENERLRAALADSIECVEEWGAYAPDYFGKKHNLAGDLARLRSALEG
jgi:hypothetical protein